MHSDQGYFDSLPSSPDATLDNEELDVMGDSFCAEQVHAEATAHIQRLIVAVARGSARHVLAGVAALQAFKTGQLQHSVVNSLWPMQDIFGGDMPDTVASAV